MLTRKLFSNSSNFAAKFSILKLRTVYIYIYNIFHGASKGERQKILWLWGHSIQLQGVDHLIFEKGWVIQWNWHISCELIWNLMHKTTSEKYSRTWAWKKKEILTRRKKISYIYMPREEHIIVHEIVKKIVPVTNHPYTPSQKSNWPRLITTT